MISVYGQRARRVQIVRFFQDLEFDLPEYSLEVGFFSIEISKPDTGFDKNGKSPGRACGGRGSHHACYARPEMHAAET